MLNVIITIMNNDKLQILETRQVSINNGVDQVKDHMLDCMYSWLDSREIVSKTYDTYDGNPVLYVEMKNGEVFTIGGNINEAEDDDQIISIPHANLAGTFRVDELRATYEELEKAFGQPCESDGYKVSTEWKLKYNGEVFSIYDYKATNLYDPELPTVKKFRSDKKPKVWSVGGRKKSIPFMNRLHDQLVQDN